MLVGCVQIASTMNVVAFALALFIVTDHSSGTSPVDVSQSELPTLTVGTAGAQGPPGPVNLIYAESGVTALPASSRVTQVAVCNRSPLRRCRRSRRNFRDLPERSSAVL